MLPASHPGGGTLRFAAVTGRGTLYIDGRQVAEKIGPRPASLKVAIAPDNAKRRLALLLETEPGERIGLSALVFVEDAEK